MDSWGRLCSGGHRKRWKRRVAGWLGWLATVGTLELRWLVTVSMRGGGEGPAGPGCVRAQACEGGSGSYR